MLKNIFSNVEIYGLCGTKETHAIEEKRVKQNPFKIYNIDHYLNIFHHLSKLKSDQLEDLKKKQIKNYF